MTASYDVDLDGSWAILGRLHGGYLLATMTDLALDKAHPHPMAVSAHYIAAPEAGPATVEVERLRTGRTIATSRMRLSQDGAVKAEVLLTSGRLDATSVPFWTNAAMPELPPLADCPRAPAESPMGHVGVLEHVDARVDLATTQWAWGEPAGQAEVRAWLRRDDGSDPGLHDLLVFADALPPVTFDLGLSGWVPTLELTVLIRALPAPGWLRAVQRARLLQDGWLDEECDLWDSAGRLVVQARQLAGYRAPAASEAG